MNKKTEYKITFEKWTTKEDYFSVMVEGIYIANYRTLTKDRVILFPIGEYFDANIAPFITTKSEIEQYIIEHLKV